MHALEALRAVAPKDMSDEQLERVVACPIEHGVCRACLAWHVQCIVERGERLRARNRELLERLSG